MFESSFETSRKEKINSNNTLLHSINQSYCLSLFVVLDLTVSSARVFWLMICGIVVIVYSVFSVSLRVPTSFFLSSLSIFDL